MLRCIALVLTLTVLAFIPYVTCAQELRLLSGDNMIMESPIYVDENETQCLPTSSPSSDRLRSLRG